MEAAHNSLPYTPEHLHGTFTNVTAQKPHLQHRCVHLLFLSIVCPTFTAFNYNALTLSLVISSVG